MSEKKKKKKKTDIIKGEDTALDLSWLAFPMLWKKDGLESEIWPKQKNIDTFLFSWYVHKCVYVNIRLVFSYFINNF